MNVVLVIYFSNGCFLVMFSPLVLNHNPDKKRWSFMFEKEMKRKSLSPGKGQHGKRKSMKSLTPLVSHTFFTF